MVWCVCVFTCVLLPSSVAYRIVFIVVGVEHYVRRFKGSEFPHFSAIQHFRLTIRVVMSTLP